jgi:hypothetical protein
MPTWALTPDGEDRPDRERKYGSLVVATRGRPEGRQLWAIAHYKQIPEWADYETSGAALSPDARQAAYASASGVWLVPVAGGTPRRLASPGEGQGFGDVAWGRDGKAVYFTRVTYGDGKATHSLECVALVKDAQPFIVKPDAQQLCLPRL